MFSTLEGEGVKKTMKNLHKKGKAEAESKR